mmetsp:Transcript_25048/g.45562  ORF Transcript_25048/g.45562 Transcript_25048/m.45562 type:complete len:323 (+) Transcript_25048:45-1013(+)
MLGFSYICLSIRDFVLVVCVQTFMLLQVGFFYARLRYQTRQKRSLVPPPSQRALNGFITVVIPVLNEEAAIESTLRHLDVAAHDAKRLRVVVADSGCTDTTMSILRRLLDEGAFKFELQLTYGTLPGRGGAIISGLEVRGVAPREEDELVLFLHADTVLPLHFDTEIRKAFESPGVLMTAFEFCTDRAQVPKGVAVPTGMAFMEFTVNLRSRLFQLPFGDQALATTRSIIDDAGGFPDYPILEEYELVQRLRRASAEGAGQIATLRKKCFCSPRRWLQRPIWRVNWVNQMVMLRYRFGATPAEVYKFYYGREPPKRPEGKTQ